MRFTYKTEGLQTDVHPDLQTSINDEIILILKIKKVNFRQQRNKIRIFASKPIEDYSVYRVNQDLTLIRAFSRIFR